MSSRLGCLLILSALFSGMMMERAQALALENPGFEDGLEGWTIPAPDHGMSRLSSAAAHSGSQGLEVEDDNPSSGSSVRSRLIPVTPGMHLRLAGFSKVVEGSGLGVYLIFSDATGKTLERKEPFVCQILNADGEWAKFTYYVPAPDQAANVAVWIHSYGKAEVRAYFDDLELTEVTSPEDARHGEEERIRNGRPGWLAAADKLPEFPKPSPEKAFSSLKITQPDGTPYRIPTENWDEARKRVGQDPEWQKWISLREEELNRWMETFPSDRTEWKGGWWHDFVSPEDGSFLVWTPAIPRLEADHLTSRTGHRVEITDKIMGGWIASFRARHVDNILEAARLWRVTGESRYRDWALGQLDFYSSNLNRWPVVANGAGTTHTRLGWQSLDEAVWLSTLTDAARLLLPDATRERQQNWYRNFFEPQAELLDRNFLSYCIHNITVWHRAAQARVALVFQNDVLWAHAMDGPYGLRAVLRKGVTSDWFWYEQSMGYNSYILSATYSLFYQAGLLGQMDRLHEQAAIVENLMLSPLTLRFPGGWLPNPADSGAPQKVPSDWFGRSYRIFPTAIGLNQAGSQRTWDTLLEPPEKIAPASALMAAKSDALLPPVESYDLASFRCALLRGGPWQIFFHYGQVNASHAQSEALNWEASWNDVMISRDNGTIGYGSTLHKEYYRKGLNHNVPLINGEGQTPWAPGELLKFEPAQSIVSAAQPRYGSSSSARRTLRIEGDCLVDALAVSSTMPATLGFALHLQGVAELPAVFASVPDAEFSKGRPVPFRYWTSLHRADFENEAAMEVTLSGGMRLRVQIMTSGRFTIWQGSAPDRLPNRRAGFYVEKDGLWTEASFITRISVIPSRSVK